MAKGWSVIVSGGPDPSMPPSSSFYRTKKGAVKGASSALKDNLSSVEDEKVLSHLERLLKERKVLEAIDEFNEYQVHAEELDAIRIDVEPATLG